MSECNEFACGCWDLFKPRKQMRHLWLSICCTCLCLYKVTFALFVICMTVTVIVNGLNPGVSRVFIRSRVPGTGTRLL